MELIIVVLVTLATAGYEPYLPAGACQTQPSSEVSNPFDKDVSTGCLESGVCEIVISR